MQRNEPEGIRSESELQINPPLEPSAIHHEGQQLQTGDRLFVGALRRVRSDVMLWGYLFEQLRQDRPQFGCHIVFQLDGIGSDG